MTDKAISPLRRRLIEDMAIRRLGPKTQHHYIRHVKRFADFLGQSADKAIAEDVHRYQLWLASIGTTVPTVNVSATALRFFFKITLKRRDLADAVVSVREPRRLPVVLSPEEVGRLLASATNIKHRAALSLTYATGLRASEVISLKRRRRAEHLALLRRAYDHHRDLRTGLPASTVAHSSNRARQLMTSTLLSPSHIAAPVRGRYLTADGYPPP